MRDRTTPRDSDELRDLGAPGHTKLDLLRFYRAECMHEFALLGMRMNWFVMVQSFLIAAFTVAVGYKVQGFNWLALMLLPLFGLATSMLIIPGVDGACVTIDMWIQKHRKLINEHHELLDFSISRDSNVALSDDRIHHRAYLFSRYLPWLALAMWVTVLALNLTKPLTFAT